MAARVENVGSGEKKFKVKQVIRNRQWKVSCNKGVLAF